MFDLAAHGSIPTIVITILIGIVMLTIRAAETFHFAVIVADAEIPTAQTIQHP